MSKLMATMPDGKDALVRQKLDLRLDIITFIMTGYFWGYLQNAA